MAKRHVNHIMAIIGELLGIVIGAAVIAWLLPLLPFVTENYQLWLPIGLMAIVLSGIAKIAAHTFAFSPASRLFIIVAHVISFYSTYKLIQIFPFDFSGMGIGFMNVFFPLVLGFTLVIVAITIIVEIVKLLLWRPMEKKLVK